MNELITEMHFGDVAVYTVPIGTGDSTLRRRREGHAVNLLVGSVFGPGHIVSHEQNGAPVVRCGNIVHANISISHNRTCAALAVCPPDCFVGIDIENNRSQQLRNVARRIFTPGEIAEYGGTEAGLLAAWTLKEAIYKSYRAGELNLRNDIRLPMPAGADTAMIRNQKIEVVAIRTIGDMMLTVVLNRFPDIAVPLV